MELKSRIRLNTENVKMNHEVEVEVFRNITTTKESTETVLRAEAYHVIVMTDLDPDTTIIVGTNHNLRILDTDHNPQNMITEIDHNLLDITENILETDLNPRHTVT